MRDRNGYRCQSDGDYFPGAVSINPVAAIIVQACRDLSQSDAEWLVTRELEVVSVSAPNPGTALTTAEARAICALAWGHGGRKDDQDSALVKLRQLAESDGVKWERGLWLHS